MRDELWVYNGKRGGKKVKQERETERKHNDSDTRVGGANDWRQDCAACPNHYCINVIRK